MVEIELDSVSKAEPDGISFDKLESPLWGAADILRASYRAVSVTYRVKTLNDKMPSLQD